MLKRLFKPSTAYAAGHALYVSAVAQARLPALYAKFGAPDTVEGRFELYSLHIYLILARLKDQGSRAAEIAQALFDIYIQALDDALREMGVGDHSIARKMRKLGEAFYGRIRSFDQAMASAPDLAPLAVVLARTVLADQPASDASQLAAYAVGQRDHLAAQSLDDLLAGRVAWVAP